MLKNKKLETTLGSIAGLLMYGCVFVYLFNIMLIKHGNEIDHEIKKQLPIIRNELQQKKREIFEKLSEFSDQHIDEQTKNP